jgi:hypothetical protein
LCAVVRRGAEIKVQRLDVKIGDGIFLRRSREPVDSKVLTPGAVGKRGPDKVVDSKKMTPAKERNADESKDSRRGVAAIEATVCREGSGRPIPID